MQKTAAKKASPKTPEAKPLEATSSSDASLVNSATESQKTQTLTAEKPRDLPTPTKMSALAYTAEELAELSLELVEQLSLVALNTKKTTKLSAPKGTIAIGFRPANSAWDYPFEQCPAELKYKLSGDTETWEWPDTWETRVDLLKPPKKSGWLNTVDATAISWLSASQQYNFAETDLKTLSTWKNLVGLELDWAALPDAQLQQIKNLKNLVYLDLSWSKIAEKTLTAIGQLESLKGLTLWATPISEEAGESLSNCTELEYLNLGGSFIENDAFRALKSLSKIKELWLWEAKITDEAFSTIAKMYELTRLELMRVPIEGWSFVHLVNKSDLQIINLRESGVKSVCLGYLEALPSLTHLDLRDTSISTKEIKQFRIRRREHRLHYVEIEE